MSGEVELVRDRDMDLDLRHVIGGEKAPDLSQQILARHGAGERTSVPEPVPVTESESGGRPLHRLDKFEQQELSLLTWPDEHRSGPHRATRRRGPRRLTAAAQWLLVACAVAVVTLLWMASGRDETPPPEPDRQPVAQDPKQERLRKDDADKQARRWVKFLEIEGRRAEAAGALLKLGSDAVPALVQALSHPQPVVGQTAAHILRMLGSQRAASRALKALRKSDNRYVAYLARYALPGFEPSGTTLVASQASQNVLELGGNGKVVRTLKGLKGPLDAERLPNGNYLVCDHDDKKVVEMTAKGKVVWSVGRLHYPLSAQRLPNGNTLIADDGCCVLEVNRAGKTVWKYDNGKPHESYRDAERLVGGNTLIVDYTRRQVIEVTPKREIVWQHKPGGRLWEADRLPNGNTLITVRSPGKILEVTPKGKVVWELKGLRYPVDADRLPNGNTLVAQQDEVCEFNAEGKKVWIVKVNQPTEVNRY